MFLEVIGISQPNATYKVNQLTAKGCFSREVLRLPPAAALGPGGSLDEFWTRAAQHCGVAEVEIDGKLVYPF